MVEARAAAPAVTWRLEATYLVTKFVQTCLGSERLCTDGRVLSAPGEPVLGSSSAVGYTAKANDGRPNATAEREQR